MAEKTLNAKASEALFFAGVGAIFAAYLIKFLDGFEVTGTSIVDTVTKTASSLGALN